MKGSIEKFVPCIADKMYVIKINDGTVKKKDHLVTMNKGRC